METIKDKIMLDLGNWLEEEHPDEDMVSKIIDLTNEHVLKLMELNKHNPNRWEYLKSKIEGK